MKKILKVLKLLVIAYALVASLASLALATHLAVEKLAGKVLIPAIKPVTDAILAREAEAVESGEIEADAQTPETSAEIEALDDELALGDLRREILQAADEIQLLESTVVNQISRDLSSMNSRVADQVGQILGPSAELLNTILADDETWQSEHGGATLDAPRLEAILAASEFETEDQVKHAVKLADLAKRIVAVRQEIERFKEVEAQFADRERRLAIFKAMASDDIAVILSGQAEAGNGVGDEQAARLLMSMEPAKVVEVLSAVAAESAARAETLASRLLPSDGGISGNPE